MNKKVIFNERTDAMQSAINERVYVFHDWMKPMRVIGMLNFGFAGLNPVKAAFVCLLTFNLILAGCGGGGGGAESTPSPGLASQTPIAPDTNEPTRPTNPIATAVSPTQINLTWLPSTDDVAVTGYRIRRGGSVFVIVGGNVTSYNNTGLTPSTFYSYTVQAIDAAGNGSDQSIPADATTFGPVVDTTAPSVPTGLSATAVSTTRINLTWSSSTDNVGVTGYRIYRGGSLLTTIGPVTSYGNTGLTPSTAYTYAVRAIDAAGNESGSSATAGATTQTPADTTPPSTPTGLNANAVSSSEIELTWNVSSDNVAVTGYRIYRGGALIATPNTNSYDDTGLTGFTVYSYTVQAVDAAGNASAQSSPDSTTTLTPLDITPPSTPTGLTATAASPTQVNLGWAASSDNVGVTGYRVYRDGLLAATLGNVTSFQDSGRTPGSTYTYAVVAFDLAGNASAQSATRNATTPTAGSISLSIAANRITGVAPLSVFFDATGTTDTGIANTFQDLEYRWDFGDPASGAVWNYGSGAGVNSRNAATGAVAGHVFESAGTYTVNLTAFDGTNTAGGSVQITVQDPNTVFAGTKTVCVSTSGTFTGAPAGCQQVTNSDWDAVIGTYVAANRRVLFRRGETWTASTSANVNAGGPWSIGAYGSGAKPRVLGSNVMYTNIIAVNAPASDGRILDLNLDGQSFTNPAVAAVGGIGASKITVLRVDAHHINRGFAWDGGEWFVVDSTFVSGVGVNNIALYTPATAGAVANNNVILGNSLSTGSASSAPETTRFPFFRKSLISNNTIAGAGPSFDAIKMHNLSTNGVWQGNYTELSIISDNRVVGSNSVTIATFGPQNAQSDERLRNLIIERNYFESTANTVVPLIIEGSQTVARNNVIYVDTGANAIQIKRRGIEPNPNSVIVYNNSVYRSNASWAFSCISFQAGSGHVAKNNICYSPNSPGPLMFDDVTNATKTNNSSNAQVKSVNPYGVIPSLPGDYDISGTSYAAGGGTAVPVFSDFFMTPKAAPYDLGAIGQ